MLTLLIIVLSSATGALLGLFLLNSGWWATAFGVVFFIAPAILINLWVKKRLEKVFTGVQEIIEHDQETLRRQMNVMQNKLVGSSKGLQMQLEKKQAQGIRQALKELDAAAPMYKWNVIAERQTNTLRAQLLYQIKEFLEADQYLEKSLILDPFTLAMKMARQYKRGETEALDKTFRKGVKRFKNEKGLLLYGLYSWVLVKTERLDEAVVVLAEGKEKTENETIQKNWEHLVNGRARLFSNAGLGDQWYALHLEQPKPVKVKQHIGRPYR